MKRQLTEQEKISANHILTRSYSLKCLQRHTNVQQVYEKMLSATSYQGNANQNHNEVSHHTCQDGYYYKKNKK